MSDIKEILEVYLGCDGDMYNYDRAMVQINKITDAKDSQIRELQARVKELEEERDKYPCDSYKELKGELAIAQEVIAEQGKCNEEYVSRVRDLEEEVKYWKSNICKVTETGE